MSAGTAGQPREPGTAKTYCRGTHRAVAPESTWERLRSVLPRIGVTRVAEVTALDRLGIPVFQAVRPASRNLSVSQGKGLTEAAARVSAAMEAVELWHAECLDSLPMVRVSLREMEAVNPLQASDLCWLPSTRRLDGFPIDWLAVHSLATGTEAWLPRRMVELDFRIAPALEPQMFHRSSNGLASGNCREEALLHGLCELIERHALFLHGHGGRRKVPLDAATVTCAECRDLIDRVRRAGARLALYDLTWEAGVAVFSAEIALPDLPRVWGGAGCHPSRDVALARALTEAAQSRLTFISGARDDLPFPADRPSPHLSFDRFVEPAGERGYAEVPDGASSDLAEDVDRVVRRLARRGHDVFAVDLTRGDVGIPVTKVFAPGLGEAHDV